MPLVVLVALFGLFFSAALGQLVTFDGQLRSKFSSTRCVITQEGGGALVIYDCWLSSVSGANQYLWKFDQLGHLRSLNGSKNLQDLDCMTTLNAGNVLTTGSCDGAPVFTYTNDHLQTVISGQTLCVDIRDPYNTGNHDAAWAWKDQNNLVVGLNPCTSRSSQNWDLHNMDSRRSPHTRLIHGFSMGTDQSLPWTFTFNSSGVAHEFNLTFGAHLQIDLKVDSAFWNVSASSPLNQVYDLGEFSFWNNGVFTLLFVPTQDNTNLPHLIQTLDYSPHSTVKNDRAHLRVISITDPRVRTAGNTVTVRIDDCFDCSFFPIATTTSTGTFSDFAEIVPDYPIQIKISTNSEILAKNKFGGGGFYSILVNDNKMEILTDVAPSMDLVPLVIAFLTILGAAAFLHVAQFVFFRVSQQLDRNNSSSTLTMSPSQSDKEQGPLLQGNANLNQMLLEPPTQQRRDSDAPVASGAQLPQPKSRLGSLDTFRGISLAIMMFVNFGGGGYPFFSHSHWNGLTVADLVFPWFMFMMGVSMALSLRSSQHRKQSIASILWRMVRRSIVLFCLGAFLVGQIDWSTVRVFGVLQYFSFSGLMVCLIALLGPKLDPTTKGLYFAWHHPTRRTTLFQPYSDVTYPLDWYRDLVVRIPEWLCVLVFPMIHLAVQFALPVPGCPTGYLGPGGEIGSHGKHPYCTGGAHRYVDFEMFGRQHSYSGGTAMDTYLTDGYYDPEGFLGALNATFLTYLGLQSGRMLLAFSTSRERLIRFGVWGGVLCAIAAILCYFSRDGGVIPVNKNMWSLSFVLLMGGSANIMLALCYYVVDVKGMWGGSPFKAVGMNSIFIYVMHEHFSDMPIPFAANIDTTGARLAKNLWVVFLWCMVAVHLKNKRIFFVV